MRWWFPLTPRLPVPRRKMPSVYTRLSKAYPQIIYILLPTAWAVSLRLHLLAKHPDLPQGRLVTLGTPAQGSKVARILEPLPLFGWAFGNSMVEGLSGEGVPDAIGREWGAVIGTLPVGLGFPFLRGEPHDGAVRVCEAEHPAQSGRMVQRVSHTAMLFSAQTFSYIQAFLTTGHFSPANNSSKRRVTAAASCVSCPLRFSKRIAPCHYCPVRRLRQARSRGKVPAPVCRVRRQCALSRYPSRSPLKTAA